MMPPTADVLGFTNRWYALVIRDSEAYELEPGFFIRLISPAAFLGTKLEAFEGRGRADPAMSRDLEDIVAVLDGRPEIEVEIAAASNELRAYILNGFRALLTNRDLFEIIQGMLPPDAISQDRAEPLLEKIRRLAGSGQGER